MIGKTVVLLLSTLASLAVAQGVPEKQLADYVKEQRKVVDEQEKELEKRIRLAERGNITVRAKKPVILQELRNRKRYVFNSHDAKEQEIKRLEKQLDSLDATDNLLPRFKFAGKLLSEEGFVGRLPNQDVTYRVIQVIDDENAIVEMKRAAVQKVYPSGAVEPNTKNWRRLVKTTERTIWLKFDTKALVDRSTFEPSVGLFRSLGTKTYTTSFGSNTLPVLESVQQDDLAELLESNNPQAKR